MQNIPQNVRHDQLHRHSRSRTEAVSVHRNLNICILCQHLQEFFDAFEAALKTAKQVFGPVISRALKPPLHLNKDQADQLRDGNEERSKSEGSEVVAERTTERSDDRVSGNSFLVTSPVPARNGTSNNTLSDSQNPIVYPKESKDEVNLEVLQRLRARIALSDIVQAVIKVAFQLFSDSIAGSSEEGHDGYEEYHPDEENDVFDEGEEDDEGHGFHGGTGFFDNLNGEADTTHHAEDDQGEDESNTADDAACQETYT